MNHYEPIRTDAVTTISINAMER